MLEYSPEDFNALLRWLDSDIERAAEKYEAIRRRLTQYFVLRQCVDPEELTDETMRRVARRVPEIATSYHGEPSRYFYGVARLILREYFRQRPLHEVREQDQLVSAPEKDENRRQYECLGKCLHTLTPDKRELVFTYYKNRKQTKISAHELAAEMEVTSAALRPRIFRLRRALQECVENCMKSQEREA